MNEKRTEGMRRRNRSEERERRRKRRIDERKGLYGKVRGMDRKRRRGREDIGKRRGRGRR